MRTFTDTMATEIVFEFMIWAQKTHPKVLANLMSGFKTHRKQLLEEEE
jgi:hypothetical protein